MAAFATALVVSAVFSLLAALFVRTFRLARKDFRLLLLVLFSFSLLGFVTGQIMGQSREPAVMGVLPAVLTLLGGIAIYLVGAKGLQTQALVAAMVSCFALALLTGSSFRGTIARRFRNSKCGLSRQPAACSRAAGGGPSFRSRNAAPATLRRFLEIEIRLCREGKARSNPLRHDLRKAAVR
jgi:hypothetical protein